MIAKAITVMEHVVHSYYLISYDFRLIPRSTSNLMRTKLEKKEKFKYPALGY